MLQDDKPFLFDAVGVILLSIVRRNESAFSSISGHNSKYHMHCFEVFFIASKSEVNPNTRCV